MEYMETSSIHTECESGEKDKHAVSRWKKFKKLFRGRTSRKKKVKEKKPFIKGHITTIQNAYFYNNKFTIPPVCNHQSLVTVDVSTQCESNQHCFSVEETEEGYMYSGYSELLPCSASQTLETDSRQMQETCNSHVSSCNNDRQVHDTGYESIKIHSLESDVKSQDPTPLTGSEHGSRDNCTPSVEVHSTKNTSSLVSKQGTERSSENISTELSELTPAPSGQIFGLESHYTAISARDTNLSRDKNCGMDLSSLEDNESCLSHTESIPYLWPHVEMEDLDTVRKSRGGLMLQKSVTEDQPEPVPISEETQPKVACNVSDKEQASSSFEVSSGYPVATKSITVGRTQSVSVDSVDDLSTGRHNDSQRQFCSKSRSAISFDKQPETNETPTSSDAEVEFTCLDKSAVVLELNQSFLVKDSGLNLSMTKENTMDSDIELKDFEMGEVNGDQTEVIPENETTVNENNKIESIQSVTLEIPAAEDISHSENMDEPLCNNAKKDFEIIERKQSSTVKIDRVNELCIDACLNDDDEDGKDDTESTLSKDNIMQPLDCSGTVNKISLIEGNTENTECGIPLKDSLVEVDIDEHETEGDTINVHTLEIDFKGQGDGTAALDVAEQTLNSPDCMINCTHLRECPVKDEINEDQTETTVTDEHMIQECNPKRTNRNEDDADEASSPLFSTPSHTETVYNILQSNVEYDVEYTVTEGEQSEEEQISGFKEKEVSDNNVSQNERVRHITENTCCNTMKTVISNPFKTDDKYDMEKHIELASSKYNSMQSLDCSGAICPSTFIDIDTEITEGDTVKVLPVEIDVKGQGSDIAAWDVTEQTLSSPVSILNGTLLKDNPVKGRIDEHQTELILMEKTMIDEDGVSKRTSRNMDDTNEISNHVFGTVQHTETVCNTLNGNDEENLHCTMADRKQSAEEPTTGFKENEVPDKIGSQHDRVKHNITGNTQCNAMKTGRVSDRCIDPCVYYDKYDTEKQLQNSELTPCRDSSITHLSCNMISITNTDRVTEKTMKVLADKEIEDKTVLFGISGQTLSSLVCTVNGLHMEEECLAEVGIDDQLTVMDDKLTKTSFKNEDDTNEKSSLQPFYWKHARPAINKVYSNVKDHPLSELGHMSAFSPMLYKKKRYRSKLYKSSQRNGEKHLDSCLSTDNLLVSKTRVKRKQRKRKHYYCKYCHSSKREPNRHCKLLHGMNLQQEKRDCTMDVNTELSTSIICDEYDSGIMISSFLSTLSTYTSLYENVQEVITNKSETKNKDHLLQLQIQLEIYEQELKRIAKRIASSWSFFTPESFIPYVVPGLRGLDSYFQQVQNGQPLSPRQSLAYEWIRFQSFHHYTGNGSGIVLARNGFYHDSENGPTATRCYACDARYSNWAYFDNPRERHQPGCPHLQGNSAENILIRSDESEDGEHASVPVHNCEAESSNHNVASTSSASNVNDTDTAAKGLQSDSNDTGAYSSVDSQTSIENGNASTADVITSTLENTSIASQSGEGYSLQPTEDRENHQFMANYIVRHQNEIDSLNHNQQTLSESFPNRNPLEDAHVSDRQSSPGLLTYQSQSTAQLDSTAPQQASSACHATAVSDSTISSQQASSWLQVDGARGHGSVVAQAVTEAIGCCETLGHTQTHPELVVIFNPQYPDYTSVAARTETLMGWPDYLDQTPRRMAEAGFFFTEDADFTRCFACGVGLRNWEARDDPVTEHIRCSPDCPYVNRLKWERYIEAVKLNQQQQLDERPRQHQLLAQRRAGRLDVSAEEVLVWILDDEDRRNAAAEHRSRRLDVSAEEVLRIPDDEDRRNAAAEQRSYQDLLEENRRLRRLLLCERCQQCRKDVVLVPCGHMLFTCQACQALYDSLGRHACPVCETVIEEKIIAKLVSDQDLLEENRRLRRLLLCERCQQCRKDVVLVPCGHMLFTCQACQALYDSLGRHACPVCETVIEEKIIAKLVSDQDLLEENRRLRRLLLCERCQQCRKDVVLVPCGHMLFTCQACQALYDSLGRHACPVCETVIEEKIIAKLVSGTNSVTGAEKWDIKDLECTDNIEQDSNPHPFVDVMPETTSEALGDEPVDPVNEVECIAKHGAIGGAENVSNALGSSQAEEMGAKPKARKQSRTVEIERLTKKVRCIICHEKDITILFMPCGHKVSCQECAYKVKQCPRCRRRIEKRL